MPFAITAAKNKLHNNKGRRMEIIAAERTYLTKMSPMKPEIIANKMFSTYENPSNELMSVDSTANTNVIAPNGILQRFNDSRIGYINNTVVIIVCSTPRFSKPSKTGCN